MAELVRDQIVTAAEADVLAAGMEAAFPRTAALPTHFRAKVLEDVSAGIAKEA